MADNIIPATVPGLGPMFTRFPPEIILEIFKLSIVVDRVTSHDNVVDKLQYDILNTFSLRNICHVSRFFRMFAMQVFYEGNNFLFQCTSVARKLTLWRTSMPPALPSPRFRHFLRRIQIEIVLEDFYFTRNPGVYNPLSAAGALVANPINNVDDLFAYSPGARQLQSLTNALTGFSDLSFLDLHIYTDVRFGHQAALNIFQQAAFAVSARNVSVTIKTKQGVTETWHSALDQMIARV